MAIMLQRLCWNNCQWKQPSGSKLGKEDSYVGKNAFGHEEWNFNTEDSLDGTTYGYIYYNPPVSSVQSSYDVYFYAIHPETKQRLLVGEYVDAQFLSDSDKAAVHERMLGIGIIKRRIEEVYALTDGIELETLSNIQKEVQISLLQKPSFNIAVSSSNVKVYSTPMVLSEKDLGGTSPGKLARYTNPKFLDKKPIGHRPSARPSEPRRSLRRRLSEVNDRRLLEDAYPRGTHRTWKLIARHHNKLSEEFRKHLRIAGVENLGAECASIDVLCTYESESYIFELKTSRGVSTRIAIREAIGQLLEYSYHPTRSPFDHMSIVLDAEPSAEDLMWIESLSQIGIEIGIVCCSPGTGVAVPFAKSPLTTALREQARR